MLFTLFTTIAVVSLGNGTEGVDRRNAAVRSRVRSNGPNEVTLAAAPVGLALCLLGRSRRAHLLTRESGLRKCRSGIIDRWVFRGQPAMTHLPSIGLAHHLLPPSRFLFLTSCIVPLLLLHPIYLVLMPRGQCMHNGLHVCTDGRMDRLPFLPSSCPHLTLVCPLFSGKSLSAMRRSYVGDVYRDGGQLGSITDSMQETPCVILEHNVLLFVI